jgi:hypothetical protein
VLICSGRHVEKYRADILRVSRGSLTGMMGMKGCRSICIVSF